jgi:hypothetical protein
MFTQKVAKKNVTRLIHYCQWLPDKYTKGNEHPIVMLVKISKLFSCRFRRRVSVFWHSEDRATWHIVIIKPTRCTNFSNLFLEWNSTCFGQFLCPASGHTAIGTSHTGFADCLLAGSGWNQNKFEKLVHLVDFITRIVTVTYILEITRNTDRLNVDSYTRKQHNQRIRQTRKHPKALLSRSDYQGGNTALLTGSAMKPPTVTLLDELDSSPSWHWNLPLQPWSDQLWGHPTFYARDATVCFSQWDKPDEEKKWELALHLVQYGVRTTLTPNLHTYSRSGA